MKFRKTAAIYSIIVGLGMIGIWTMLLVTGQDSQLQDEFRTIPFSISLAIFSDFVTAFALLASGIGLLGDFKWATKAFLLSMGLLSYSVINALGLYGQRGDTAYIIMFFVILVFATIFTISAFRSKIHLA